MADPIYYSWIDLETSGLDERLDPIIEIGLVLTKVAPPCTEVAFFEALIKPEDSTWTDRLDPIVLQMHTDNGLLDEVEANGRPLREVELDIINLLYSLGRPHNFMLAGSGVGHFDRRFIQAQMPGFNKWLQYPCLDVGVFRRGFKFCGRSDLDAFGQTFLGSDKPHRGLADVRDHLNEWRQYASVIQSIERDV